MNFPITLDQAAQDRVKKLLAKDGRADAALRIGVKGGGCSGFEYVMKIETDVKENDLSLSFNDVRVVCDPKSAKFLEGATLVYTGNLIGGGFRFDNPNASRSCGCGSSFTPKPAR